MPYITDNPVLDAQIYFLEERPMEFKYKCLCCGEGFDNGYIAGGEERFCKDCFLSKKYLLYYKNTLNWDDKLINTTLEQYPAKEI